MLVHSIRADDVMTTHSVSSKLNPDWDFLCRLKGSGSATAAHWLHDHYDDVGVRSSVDLQEEFL
jgi:NTE family protein